MRALVPALALLLAGCDKPTAADGYRFEQAEFDLEAVHVAMVQYDSRAAFEQAARVEGKDPTRLEAFAVLYPQSARCVIHIERVATNYRPEWLGHELAHCLHGRWHR